MSKLKQKVATLLNNLDLTIGNDKLVFCEDDIHCATGSYRSNTALDCARWEVYPKIIRADGSMYNAGHYHSYETLTKISKASSLGISEYTGEIYDIYEEN